MRKIILVLFLSFSLLGASGFLINGDSVATITIGDSITVTGTFEGGDSIAEATIRIADNPPFFQQPPSKA